MNYIQIYALVLLSMHVWAAVVCLWRGNKIAKFVTYEQIAYKITWRAFIWLPVAGRVLDVW